MENPASTKRLLARKPRVALMWRTKCALYGNQASDVLPVRLALMEDSHKIASLCQRAFLGTHDEASAENFLDKVSGIFSAKYGAFIASASFVHASVGGEIDAAILVTDHVPYGSPVIALVVVGEGVQRRGIGRALLLRSLAILTQQGKAACCARITCANEPSERLFRACGFAPDSV